MSCRFLPKGLAASGSACPAVFFLFSSYTFFFYLRFSEPPPVFCLWPALFPLFPKFPCPFPLLNRLPIFIYRPGERNAFNGRGRLRAFSRANVFLKPFPLSSSVPGETQLLLSFFIFFPRPFPSRVSKPWPLSSLVIPLCITLRMRVHARTIDGTFVFTLGFSSVCDVSFSFYRPSPSSFFARPPPPPHAGL